MDLQKFKKDIPASVVVFFVALPLCLGVALASGAPLFSGLIAGIVGGIVVGAVSGSRLGVSGPAAGLTVIVLSAIETLGSFEIFLLAVVIGGLMQILLGLLRAGIFGYFFPSSVINGMLTGIGLIIVLKQIPYAFGLDDGASMSDGLSGLWAGVHPGVLVIFALSLALLIAWESPLVKKSRWLSMVPGPVVAVLSAVVLYLLFGKSASLGLNESHLVTVPVATSFNEFVGLFTLPDFSQLANPLVWTVAATIAVVASLETLLSVEAIDKMDPLKRTTPTNRELVAQGVGNSVSGLIGGLPVTQVIVRSSVNLQTGARSKASTICHGLLLLVCVATLPTWLNMIPLGVLASVLILTGYKLAKPALFRKMWDSGMEQFLPFVITVLGVVFTDLLTGVGVGMVAAIFALLRRNYLNSHFLHKKQDTEEGDRIRINMQLAEEVTFLNKGAIRKELSEVPDNAHVILDKRNCVYINHDVAETIADFIETAAARGIDVDVIERKNVVPIWDAREFKAVA
ncbi:SulP family inorganic anion transporter [Microbulbifer sp. CAU 1566]|uniref:SulP family inorganic anion transporter n=1 Tax=Microbulbifer sp. CAU 1566 TaxID=2933269 RepID=UPI00200522A7|nr:SulP family inorganic anion transporter [Microbulbifer sp. CAU 1566]MCK7596847.1 SulP family inorganic anion transporter [Microbulbifer sp. CAU 1566]